MIAGKSFAREGEVVGPGTDALCRAKTPMPTTTLAGREARVNMRKSAKESMPPPVSNPREGRWAIVDVRASADLCVPGDSFGSDAKPLMRKSAPGAMRATVFNSSGGRQDNARKSRITSAPAGSLSGEEASVAMRISAVRQMPPSVPTREAVKLVMRESANDYMPFSIPSHAT